MPLEKKQKKRISKLLSYILRHDPESIGITVDNYGYANVSLLIESVIRNKKVVLDFDILCDIVDTDNKQRYSFNEDKTKIRANQGHSIEVDVGLCKKIPPDILYHGTAVCFESSIDTEGILPMGRLYVHLSNDIETAIIVGKRHGSPLVYTINCSKMIDQGYTFYLSKNNVWLVVRVPVQFIEKLN